MGLEADTATDLSPSAQPKGKWRSRHFILMQMYNNLLLIAQAPHPPTNRDGDSNFCPLTPAQLVASVWEIDSHHCASRRRLTLAYFCSEKLSSAHILQL